MNVDQIADSFLRNQLWQKEQRAPSKVELYKGSALWFLLRWSIFPSRGSPLRTLTWPLSRGPCGNLVPGMEIPTKYRASERHRSSSSCPAQVIPENTSLFQSDYNLHRGPRLTPRGLAILGFYSLRQCVR